MTLLAAVLAAALPLFSVPSHAADSEHGASNEAKLRVAVEGLNKEVDKVKGCNQGVDGLRQDLAKAKTRYESEFGGRVPPEFRDVLDRKRMRVGRASEICLRTFKDSLAQFDGVWEMVRRTDPNKTDIKEVSAEFESIKKRFMVLERKKEGGESQGQGDR